MTKRGGLQVIAAALCVALFGGAAQAATVGFDGGKPKKGAAYVEDGFAFDDARIVNGGCMKGGCVALNDNERMVMTLASGELFDLSSISFSLLGEGDDGKDKAGKGSKKKRGDDDGVTLTITADDAAAISFSSRDFRAKGFQTVDLDSDFFSNVRSLFFSTDSGGNVRLDAFSATASAPVATAPLPASAGLLLGALSGLCFLRRRRAA